MILWDKHPAHLQLANEKLGTNFNPTQVMWRTLLKADLTPQAVIIFSDWTPWCCEVSGVVLEKGCVTRFFIHSCAEYAFRHVGRVNAVVRADNKEVLALLPRLGFTQEAVLRQWYGEQDGVLFRMLRDQCKWLRNKHEEPLAAACA